MELITTENNQKIRKTDQTFAKCLTVFPFLDAHCEVMPPARYLHETLSLDNQQERPAQKHGFLPKTQQLRKHDLLCVGNKGN